MWTDLLVWWAIMSVVIGAGVQLAMLHEVLSTVSVAAWMVVGRIVGHIVKMAIIFLICVFTIGGGDSPPDEAEMLVSWPDWSDVCPDRPKVYHFVKTTQQYVNAINEIKEWDNAYLSPMTHIIEGLPGNEIAQDIHVTIGTFRHTCIQFQKLNFTGPSVTDYGNDSLPAFPEDTDGDGMPNSFETTWYPNLDENVADADEDLDGDGWYNIEEYLNGTNPTIYDNRPTYVEAEDGTRFVSYRNVIRDTAYSNVQWPGAVDTVGMPSTYFRDHIHISDKIPHANNNAVYRGVRVYKMKQ